MARKGRDEQDGSEKKGRFAQIKQTYRMAKKSDPYLGWITLGTVLAVLAVLVLVGVLLGPVWLWPILGLPLALLAGALVFGRRAERAAYSQIEGQPGAAVAALGTLRRGWDTTPVVATNRHQDVVHRAVGRPGVVLVGEGTSATRVAKHVMKLPRSLRPAELTELRSRLRALGTQPLAMPKGPLPRGMKIPRGGMPR